MRAIIITFIVLLFELSSDGAVSAAEPLKVGLVFIAPVDEDVWSYGQNQTRLAVGAQFGNRVQSTCVDIEAYGEERWFWEWSQELKAKTCELQAVRQVLIPKKQKGMLCQLGIPCLRDRVVQTSAMLVVSPIIEADLGQEQYAYRTDRSANDAVNRVQSLLNTGHQEVVDADLSNYFGELPYAELMRSLARRISDGAMLGLIRSWLIMPVEEDDGKGGKRRTNRAKK